MFIKFRYTYFIVFWVIK